MEKLAEEKLTKIDELSQRVLAFEVQLRSGVNMLKASMIQNFACLEFNRDLLDLV